MHQRRTQTSADVFERAAAETRRRLRRDARLFAGDAEVNRLFEQLEDLVFDPRLDVAYLVSAARVSRDARDRFSARLGPPKTYIAELRVTAAETLLRETDERVADIGRRVGYEVARTFSRVFKRLRGMTPAELRRQADETEDASPDDALPVDTSSANTASVDDADLSPRALATRWRRRVTLGQLDARETAEMRRQLRRRYPHLRQPAFPWGAGAPLPGWVMRPVQILPTGDDLEDFVLQVVFTRVLSLPEEDRRHALFKGLRFRIPSMLQFLDRTCMAWLGERPDEAVALAELAVEIVDTHLRSLGPRDVEWRAMAWICLGRVRLLAGRPGAAARALTFARAEWRDLPRKYPSPIRMHLLHFESWLSTAQRRYDDAAAALDRALALGSGDERLRQLWITCALDRAELAMNDGNLWKAEQALLGAEAAGAHPALVAHRRANLRARGRAHEEATRLYAEARRLAGEREGIGLEGYFLEALIDRDEARHRQRTRRLEDAADLFRSARDGFRDLGARYWTAAATAELAGVCSVLERYDELPELLHEAIAELESAALHREARMATFLLRSIPKREEPIEDLEVLADLRRCLDFVTRELPS